MNVYDFDGTIYDGDSTIDFYLHCLRKYPYIVRFIPRQLISIIKYKLHIIAKLSMKEQFYSYFSTLNNIDEDVKSFWDSHQSKIKEWYVQQQKEDDLIISASPTFFIQEGCNRIGIKHVIASSVDKTTGKCTGENCYGMEKVYRYIQIYNHLPIDNFYSDSKSDQPMAEMAINSWRVKKNLILPWN